MIVMSKRNVKVAAALAAEMDKTARVAGVVDAARLFGLAVNKAEGTVASARALVCDVIGKETFAKGFDMLGGELQDAIRSGIRQSIIETTPDRHYIRQEDRSLVRCEVGKGDVVVSMAFALSEAADARNLKTTDFAMYLAASCPANDRPDGHKEVSMRAQGNNLTTKRISRIWELPDLEAIEAKAARGKGTTHADPFEQIVEEATRRLEVMAKQAKKKVANDLQTKFAKVRAMIEAVRDEAAAK
jgi:hypothetical protein